VISKGKSLSPFLADFKDSNFEAGISKFFGSKKKVYIYNISSSASTYIRSLKELRALEFASGSMEELNELLHRGHFPVTPENDQQIVIHDARLLITKKPTEKSQGNDNAPDHLARLFAYNHIMQQVGSHFFTKDFINEKLVNEASSAYVVSPVSSLIVLETKEDYERFGITDSENSLHNASKQSSGAVPEPHEWVLIILFAGIVFYCFYKQRTKLADSVK
jgi:XrtN system VIT domain protein